MVREQVEKGLACLVHPSHALDDKVCNFLLYERPLSPVGGKGALCSGSHHCYSSKNEATQQSTRGGAEKQTIYCPARRLRKKDDKKEKSGFSYFLSFDSSFDNLTTETGREVKTATAA